MKPRAFLSALPIDLILLLMMLVVAVVSDSITLLGETIRSALMMIVGIWAWVAFTAEERDARQRYEFGAGKLQQAGNLIIALAMVAGGLWIGSLAFELAVLAKSEVTPFGLALAATVNAMYAIRRGALIWTGLSTRRGLSIRRKNEAPAEGPPLLAASVMLAPLLIVQMTLTVAALARDPGIAIGADCLGAIFVGLLMTTAGIKTLWEAGLDLIDHPLQERVEKTIAQLLFEQGIHRRELLGMRSRRSGRHVFVELTMDPVDADSFEEVRQRLARVRRNLENRLGGLDLAIRLHMPEADYRGHGLGGD
ncbi:MAG TPA: cation transporter [Geminicoccaceae bacterium]|nr:cation transporter [Geminicoccaceae bacterium]